MTQTELPGRSDELRALAQRLMQIADEADARPRQHTSGERKRPADEADYSPQFLRALALEVYRRRRRRAEYFERELFGEIAWDMLLDLFVYAMEGKRVSTTSLCIAAEAPPTTGLRWITMLEEKGLAERSGSDSDARLTYVSITEEGRDAMKRFLARECAAYRDPGGFMLAG